MWPGTVSFGFGLVVGFVGVFLGILGPIVATTVIALAWPLYPPSRRLSVLAIAGILSGVVIHVVLSALLSS